MRSIYPRVVPNALFAVVALAALFSPAGATTKEAVIYSFQGQPDGLTADSTLIADKKGNLFGVTYYGGTGGCTYFLGNGCGTVFELSQRHQGQWTAKQLYSFQAASDGQYPKSALSFDRRGNLYGVTTQGGTGNCTNMRLTGCGTVFELSPQDDGTWRESVLYSFQGVPSGSGDGDAAQPNSLVFDTFGNLFGFSDQGGSCFTEGGLAYCNGTAFELEKHAGGWREKVIYVADASTGSPAGATFDAEGYLYAVSPFAGSEGAGDVFRLTPPSGKGKWSAQILYTFQNANDGAIPTSGFVFDAAGDLYGASNGTDSVAGNVFELTPTSDGPWTEAVVFSFSQEGFDVYPLQGPIMDEQGDLFGTTAIGGVNGDGLIYKISRDHGAWSGKILHAFTSGQDGSEPSGGLIFGRDNALYGATAEGGTGSCENGCGTVFRVKP